MKRSQLRRIIREEMGMLNENENEKFLQVAIKEFSKKTGINLTKLPYKEITIGRNPEYRIDITNQLSKNPILSTLFKILTVTFEQNILSETEESIVYVVSLDWALRTMGSNSNRIATLRVNKQSGKVDYFNY